MTDVSLRCRCGHLRGIARGLTPREGTHVSCYCDDCQAYARYLGDEGITDSAGGTEIFQTAPARVTLTQGEDALACVRLSEKGLFRWYASCCKTPVGNTAGARIPFVGLVHTFFELSPAERERVLGPTVPVQTKFARAPGVAGSKRDEVALILRVVRNLAKWWVKKMGTSPFFTAGGESVVPPKILSADERAVLR